MLNLSRGRRLQLGDDHPLQRLDGLEILRRDLGLGNREVELGLDAEHQIDHVHRGQAGVDELRLRRDVGAERVLREDALHQLDDAISHVGIEGLHRQIPMSVGGRTGLTATMDTDRRSRNGREDYFAFLSKQ